MSNQGESDAVAGLDTFRWLSNLSDEDYVKFKTRYADFADFAMKLKIMKTTKYAMFTAIEPLRAHMSEELIAEILLDKSLPKSLVEEIIENDDSVPQSVRDAIKANKSV